MGRDGFLKLLRPPPWGFFFGVKSRSLNFVFFLVVSFFSTYIGPLVTGILFGGNSFCHRHLRMPKGDSEAR